MSTSTATVPSAAPPKCDLNELLTVVKQWQGANKWMLISPAGAVYATDNANEMVKVLSPHTDIGRIT